MTKIKATLLSIIIFIFIFTPVSAEVYKWVDNDGEVHFSDSAPMEGEIQRDVEVIETQYDDYSYSGEYEEGGNADIDGGDYSDFGGKAPYDIYAGKRIHAIFSYPYDTKHMKYISLAVENLHDYLYGDGFREISKKELLSIDYIDDGLRQSILAAAEVTAYKAGPSDIRPAYMVLLQTRMPDSKGREVIRSVAESFYYYAGQYEPAKKKYRAASDYFHKLTLWSIKDRQKIRKLMGSNCYIKQLR